MYGKSGHNFGLCGVGPSGLKKTKGFLAFHILYLALKISSCGMLLQQIHYIFLSKFSVLLCIKVVKDYLKAEIQFDHEMPAQVSSSILEKSSSKSQAKCHMR